jgi:hypothetical protein
VIAHPEDGAALDGDGVGATAAGRRGGGGQGGARSGSGSSSRDGRDTHTTGRRWSLPSLAGPAWLRSSGARQRDRSLRQSKVDQPPHTAEEGTHTDDSPGN